MGVSIYCNIYIYMYDNPLKWKVHYFQTKPISFWSSSQGTPRYWPSKGFSKPRTCMKLGLMASCNSPNSIWRFVFSRTEKNIGRNGGFVLRNEMGLSARKREPPSMGTIPWNWQPEIFRQSRIPLSHLFF